MGKSHTPQPAMPTLPKLEAECYIGINRNPPIKSHSKLASFPLSYLKREKQTPKPELSLLKLPDDCIWVIIGFLKDHTDPFDLIHFASVNERVREVCCERGNLESMTRDFLALFSKGAQAREWSAVEHYKRCKWLANWGYQKGLQTGGGLMHGMWLSYLTPELRPPSYFVGVVYRKFKRRMEVEMRKEQRERKR